ncbi:hypothetical protein LEP1GSC195_0646 [Leptospira wolbachii serovar Codice str. CDC]|uniref:Lipoprotein n=1 Tax=Leptospira wolbachii serovar Codice str. CDC TaxID=1218599 RepID=R9AE17_9LEPT|nr:hypothetical protein [Leptospira wolbachii]EOQ98335.1 hypothetical protein LEP1GSC195_0646 [Leptospira wolbachii serovar Codice str. CDC]
MEKKIKFHKLTKLLLLITLFLNFTCAADVRLLNPIDSNEAKNQTLVGFIILDDLNNDAQDASAMILKVHPILSTEMVIFDWQSKTPVENLSNAKKPMVTVEEDGEKVSYTNQLVTSTPTFILDSRKDHYLGYMQWERFCNHCSKPTSYRINLEPQKSFSTLKIKGKPGEIVFLGIYRVSVTKEDFNINQILTNQARKLDYVFERISPNSPFWQKDFRDYYIWSKFEKEYGYNERSAEIKFLKNIINGQQKGYWKEKAEKRLSELLAAK